ncbi:hypothetical protein OIU84_008173 [Salix udensis]|uniref:Uncharacterized protein n=1 Tax=Salix udensis TaxID=889485 RepID=A0AAD6P061_9ROSI|nr:hypothetical protein OIU84_008173 [Salix udensis]
MSENRAVISSLNPASVMSVFIPAPDGPTPLPIPPRTPVGVAEYGVVVPVGVAVVDGVAVEGVVLDGFVVTGVVLVPEAGVVLVPAALDKRRSADSF